MKVKSRVLGKRQGKGLERRHFYEHIIMCVFLGIGAAGISLSALPLRDLLWRLLGEHITPSPAPPFGAFAAL